MSASEVSPKQPRIELAGPDPHWRAAYELESLCIQAALAELGPLHIEHIGSTAIPGIRAKPILDIMVGVESYDWLEGARIRLQALGYDYDANALSDDPGRHVFRMGPSRRSCLRTHLHYTLLGSRYWVRILAFRNYLRRNREVALEYEHLKMSLAARYPKDGKAYTRDKGAFVRRVQAIAIQEGAWTATP